MTDQTPTAVPDDAKTPSSRFRIPFKKNDNTPDSTSTVHSTKEKAKNVLAAVGVVAVVTVVAGAVAKHRGVTGAEVTLPEVNVTEEN